MTKKTKITALIFLLGFAAGVLIYFGSRPKGTDDAKTVTVEVIHKDESTNTFEYETDKEFLGELLLEEGLVDGEQGDYGLYVKEVDGETADYDVDGSWWQLDVNGEMSQTGADEVVLSDGDVYTWTYVSE